LVGIAFDRIKIMNNKNDHILYIYFKYTDNLIATGNIINIITDDYETYEF